MKPKTTNKGLQERQDTPQVLTASGESFNPKSVPNAGDSTNSMPSVHSGCGYNSRKGDSLSKQHTVFVIGIDGTPLTPTTPSKSEETNERKASKT